MASEMQRERTNMHRAAFTLLSILGITAMCAAVCIGGTASGFLFFAGLVAFLAGIIFR